jgi:DNA-3-methyladenine glycosylase II
MKTRIVINPKKLRILKPTKNPFLSLARSIIYQQISTKAGDSIYKKFISLFPRKTPTPKVLLSLSEQTIRSAGLSGQKLSYLQDLSRKFLDKTISPKQFSKMSDNEIIDHLVQVKGIGIWTAHMFLIFALNRPDVLPIGDLAIKKGFQKAFQLRKIPSDTKMLQLAKEFSGKRTRLSLHLWSLFDVKE